MSGQVSDSIGKGASHEKKINIPAVGNAHHTWSKKLPNVGILRLPCSR